MQKLIFILVFGLAGASLCGQSTEINVTALLKPGANSTFLTTDGSGNVVWGNAATLLTAGTGISVSGNTVSVNNIPETSIQDGSIIARVAGNENISGTWRFNSILLMKDAQSSFYDDSDNTKQMRFQLSGVNTGTTRNLTVPNADGTLALTSNLISEMSGDVSLSGFSGSVTATIANGAVSNAKFRNSSGLSLVGRSANSTGAVADITGTVQTSPQVQGTTLGFFPIPSKTFFHSATMPTVVGNTSEVGALIHNESGRNALVQIDMLIQVSGYSSSKRYVFPLGFNSVSGGWVKLIPQLSYGVYSGQDIELEIRTNTSGSPTGGIDTIRMVRTAGNVAGSADFVIQYFGSNVDDNNFTATSNTSTSSVTATYNKQSLVQVANRAGVNTYAPGAAFDVVGTGNTSSTLGFRVLNSSGSTGLVVEDGGLAAFGGNATSSYRLTSHGAFTTNAGVVRALGSGSQSSLSSASVFVENSGGNKYTITTTDAGHFRIYLNNTLLTTQIRLSNLEFRHFATGAFGPSNSSIEGGGLVYTDSLASDAIIAAENKRANGSADAVLYAKTAISGGDAKIKLEAGSVLWTLGNDISDGALKIGNQDDPGTSPVAAISSTSVQVNTQIFSNKFALTDGSTIAVNWNNGNAQSVTLGGNRTVTFANPKSGAVYRLYLKQDGTGNRTVNWPTIKWQGGSAPTLTTAANKTDIITVVWDGTDYFGSASLNY